MIAVISLTIVSTLAFVIITLHLLGQSWRQKIKTNTITTDDGVELSCTITSIKSPCVPIERISIDLSDECYKPQYSSYTIKLYRDTLEELKSYQIPLREHELL